jgi:hypothetical protein
MRMAAVLPHPPLLVPELVGDGAEQVVPVLSACDRVLARVRSVPGVGSTVPLVLVGGGGLTRRHPSSAWGSLAGFGVPVHAPARHGDDLPTLPLSLTVGRWLLDRGQPDGIAPVLQEVAADASPAICADLGRSLRREVGPAVWLVLGDGSACRSERAPGFLDPRAEQLDGAVADALHRGDPAALAALDPQLCRELLVGGRAAWQVLAGAVPRSPAGSELALACAPFGIGYLVGLWEW